ncbi:uncharacterized protein F5891DRAFT_1225459 [Suillus fuscotomentosus]|uniref:Uncharacterized protein n=1 Tax=Suillus fuscotomentosus TaxID=1912939 RepID=A0AAD4HMF5_9AGAM|nr:uncharacterized protein F5891DRAFT_1225459 [Suillus fuscotomentosus]KAG1900824.1 hypothetical protein F5891DRAFT_1225459 [Suillus fuscotomentosus]
MSARPQPMIRQWAVETGNLWVTFSPSGIGKEWTTFSPVHDCLVSCDSPLWTAYALSSLVNQRVDPKTRVESDKEVSEDFFLVSWDFAEEGPLAGEVVRHYGGYICNPVAKTQPSGGLWLTVKLPSTRMRLFTGFSEEWCQGIQSESAKQRYILMQRAVAANDPQAESDSAERLSTRDLTTL